MNNLDKQYTALLQDILDNGHAKSDRTGTGTISVFGRQIRHRMSEGFPLLTTKRIPFRLVVTELLWFLRGSTNIKYLVDNDVHIWDGDAYKNYWNSIETSEYDGFGPTSIKLPTLTQEEFINKIKTDDEFAKKFGELGSIYGKQWRNWGSEEILVEKSFGDDEGFSYKRKVKEQTKGVDQISELIKQLKENPDSRRLLVSAWNPSDLPNQVLPPCHYGFQVYTRELSEQERMDLYNKSNWNKDIFPSDVSGWNRLFDAYNIPTRAISLMWNQRSVDTFLGLPFNIASYGLLLEIIAKTVNMVPDELIGNLGDVHLYSNHVDQALEQIGRKYTPDERSEVLKDAMSHRIYNKTVNELMPFGGGLSEYYEIHKIPYHTREPYPLPTLNINTEFWPYEGGECGTGLLDAVKVFEAFKDENFCRCLLEEDIQLGNYQSHPTIKAPLSN